MVAGAGVALPPALTDGAGAAVTVAMVAGVAVLLARTVDAGSAVTVATVTAATCELA
jgi:hypothetical protein